MKVHFVRHTSVDVPRGMCYGQTDVPLRPSFAEEAAAVLARVKELQYTKVYTSPLSRCVRLATYCGHADAERDARLLEMNFGAWEGARLYEMDTPEVRWWFEDQLRRPALKGESVDICAWRDNPERGVTAGEGSNRGSLRPFASLRVGAFVRIRRSLIVG